MGTHLEIKVHPPPILSSPDRVVTSDLTVGAVITEFLSRARGDLGGSKSGILGQNWHSSQEVGTNDDVKGVRVQHSAVSGHSFVVKTNSHINTPQGMDGMPIHYSYGQCLNFLESLKQAPGHYRKCCAGVKHCSKNLIPDFHEDPENQVLFFEAAPLLLSRELDIHPCSHERLGHSGQSPLLGVIPLRGGVIPLWALLGVTFGRRGSSSGR